MWRSWYEIIEGKIGVLQVLDGGVHLARLAEVLRERGQVVAELEGVVVREVAQHVLCGLRGVPA